MELPQQGSFLIRVTIMSSGFRNLADLDLSPAQMTLEKLLTPLNLLLTPSSVTCSLLLSKSRLIADCCNWWAVVAGWWAINAQHEAWEIVSAHEMLVAMIQESTACLVSQLSHTVSAKTSWVNFLPCYYSSSADNTSRLEGKWLVGKSPISKSLGENGELEWEFLQTSGASSSWRSSCCVWHNSTNGALVPPRSLTGDPCPSQRFSIPRLSYLLSK